MAARSRRMPRHSNRGNFIVSTMTTEQLVFMVGGLAIFGILDILILRPMMGGITAGFMIVTGILGVSWFVALHFLLNIRIKKYQDMKGYEVILNKPKRRFTQNEYVLDQYYQEERQLPDIESAVKTIHFDN